MNDMIQIYDDPKLCYNQKLYNAPIPIILIFKHVINHKICISMELIPTICD